MRRLAWVLAALPVWGAEPRPARAAEPTVATGKRVEVRSTVEDPETAAACRDLLEAALPAIEAALPYRMPADARLVVNLYGKEEEYVAAVRGQGGSAHLEGQLAATMWSTSESHVLVQPRAEPEYLARVGHLPELTRYLVAHEAVHQVAYRAKAPNHKWWPTWYAEGTANFVAERCLAAGKEGAPAPIVVDDARHLAREALAAGRPLRLDRLLYADVTAFEGRHLLYAQVTELVRLLASDADRFRLLNARIRDLPMPPLPDAGGRDHRALVHARACAKAVEEVYGPGDALAQRLRAQAASAAPRWCQPWRCAERAGEALVTASFPGLSAVALPTEAAAPSKPFVLTAEVEILPLGKQQADVVLAYEDRFDPRFLKVAIGTAGFVTLLAFSDGAWQDRYRWNVAVPPEDVRAGTTIPVAVEVAADVVRVSLHGKPVMDAVVPPGFDALGGRHGFGARDGVAVWRKVEVKEASARKTGGEPEGK